jgi:hypothetical protein
VRRTAALACSLGLLSLAAAPASADQPQGMVTEPSTTYSAGGESVEVSMHGDRMPPGSDFELRTRERTVPRIAEAALPATWCGSERSADDTANASHSGARVKVVYAHAADQPNRFGTYRDLIQSDIGTVANWVAAASGGQRTIRFDTGTECGPDYVDIASIQLPRTRATYTGSAGRAGMVMQDVKAALSGMTGTRNYLVYADGLYANDWVLGTAQMPEDDRASAANFANYGGTVAMVWGDGDPDFIMDRLTTVLHEVSHTLGAVQDSAPQSSGAGHCFEMHDVMCYPDGGPRGSSSDLVFNCAETAPLLAYECGMDDYFNPSPASGSYLDTHWNLFDAAFMCEVASCVLPKGTTPPPPDPTPTPAPTPADPGPVAPPPGPDPGQPAGEDAAVWLNGFMAGGTSALKKLGLRGLAQGRALTLSGTAPIGHSVQVDLMMGAAALTGGALDASGKTRLKIPRAHRRILAKRRSVRLVLQGVIRAAAGGGPPTVKRVSVTLKLPAKKRKRRR